VPWERAGVQHVKCLPLPKLLFALKVVKSVNEITQYLICRDGEVLGEALSNRLSERLCLRKSE